MKEELHRARFTQLLRDIFTELDDSTSHWKVTDSTEGHIVIASDAKGEAYHLDVMIRERITPQIAEDLFSRFSKAPLPERVIRIAYAPVISNRVAEIARSHGVSFMDYAGNCRIVDRAAGLLISRSGKPNTASKGTQRTTDPFAPKSSRIIRAMLHETSRGWQVRQLADHSDVDVSIGLVSKVTQALIQESYATVRDRLLHLTQPISLLNAWASKYPGPFARRKLYMRGDAGEAERTISSWCEASNIAYALAEFSAAWRYAPSVRYAVASLYVAPDALGPSQLDSLRRTCGAREVDSGANLVILTPFDTSVFAQRVAAPEQTTSPLQTFLDLKFMGGRGSDAADAVFEKHLRTLLDFGHSEGGD